MILLRMGIEFRGSSVCETPVVDQNTVIKQLMLCVARFDNLLITVEVY